MYKHEFLLCATFQHPLQAMTKGKAHKASGTVVEAETDKTGITTNPLLENFACLLSKNSDSSSHRQLHTALIPPLLSARLAKHQPVSFLRP